MVASVDHANQVSALSAEEVMDTPRPEDTEILYDMAIQPNASGLMLDTFPAVVAWDNPLADVYIDSDGEGVLYINAANIGVDIQDMGYTDSFDDIGWAPSDGWSVNGWAELIEGHTYVVWDDDLFFAKIRVEVKGSSSIAIRWAFQLDNNNPELIAPQYNAPKPVHSAQYLKSFTSANK